MFCPACGTSAPEGAAFCVACGSTLPSSLPPTPGAGQPDGAPPAQAARPPAPVVSGPCPKCGAGLQGAAFYCPACGNAVGPGAERSAAPGSQGNRVCRSCRRVGPSNLVTCPHCGGPMKSQGLGGGMVAVLALVAVLFVGFVALLAAILVPNFIRARAQGQFTACKSNLKNLGTALEMWSTDNAGLYPESLSSLTPNYLRALPTCPAASQETYSAGYVVGRNPDSYTVVCTGDHHRVLGVEPNYPQYNSIQGLVDR